MQDSDLWVSPVQGIRRYIETTRRYLSTRSAALGWVSGGIAVESDYTEVTRLGSFQLANSRPLSVPVLEANLSVSMPWFDNCVVSPWLFALVNFV